MEIMIKLIFNYLIILLCFNSINTQCYKNTISYSITMYGKNKYILIPNYMGTTK